MEDKRTKLPEGAKVIPELPKKPLTEAEIKNAAMVAARAELDAKAQLQQGAIDRFNKAKNDLEALGLTLNIEQVIRIVPKQ